MAVRFFVLLLLSLFTFVSYAEEQKAPHPDKAIVSIAQTACAACHGKDGNSAAALYPKLAGQHQGYLLKQLQNFKSGQRDNAVMKLQVENLTESNLQSLAAYYANQKIKLGKAKEHGAASLGEQIYRGGIAEKKLPACAACHGANGEGIPKLFPRLSAQHAAYTTQQLKAFRTGERANGPMMTTIAEKMTDAEMAAVADYIQGLR